MIYGGTITTPANTAKVSPKVTEIAVTLGLIYHLKVVFPPGPSGLLHVQIFDGTYQVFPTTHGASFRGDNLALVFDELYDKSIEPMLLSVHTWNLDTTYEHDVEVLISLVSKEEFQARYLPMTANNALVQALAEQEVLSTSARRERVKRFLETTGEGAGE